MGGGGDNGEYSAKQAEMEARKARARNALNVMFGVAPTAPDQANYVQGRGRKSFVFNPITGFLGPDDIERGDPFTSGLAGTNPEGYVADPASYQGAVQLANSQREQANANKTARDALYQKIRDDAFGAGKRGLDDRRDVAKRQNKFALFAQGLAGGSEDIDQNALLQRTYNDGTLQLGARADAAKTDMMSSDEQTRLGLLQSIDAGMDEGSAISSAIGQLKVNSDRAAAQAQGTTLGDLFADAGLLYTESNAAKGRNAARNMWSGLFPTNPKPAGGNKGSGGTITGIGGP